MKSTIIFVTLFSLFASTQAHAWVVKSDFETGTLGERAHKDPSGATYAHSLTIFSDENPHSGNQSAKATVPAGGTGGTEWGANYTFPRLSEGDEIWFRAWINFPHDFQWDSRHGTKGLRLRVYNSAGDTSRYINVYTRHNNVHTENWVDLKVFFQNNTQESTTIYPEVRGWEALEMYVKLSATPGKGILRLWRNGTLWFEDKLTKTLLDPGSYLEKASIFTHYSNYPSPVTQSTYIDDVIITNERPSNTDSKGNPYIGVGDVKTVAPPTPPTGIK